MANPNLVLHLPFLLNAFAFAAVVVFLLPVISTAASFDFPTANLSTLWTLGAALYYSNGVTRIVSYPNGITIYPLLLRGTIGPAFTLGFTCSSPCSSFLLSISIVSTNSGSRITNLNAAPPQIVWSPNRARPVRLNATLLFSPSGDLILSDADGSLVWSTNTSGASLTVLHNGNLVIVDNKGDRVWASFDHPTDSLLLGQSLKQGQRLSSNSSANATQGQFYITVDSNGLRAFVDSNPPQLYYAKPNASSAKPQNSSAFAIFNNGSLDIFLSSAQPNSPDYSISLPTSHSVQYMRLDSNGYLGLYIWSYFWSPVQQVFDHFPDSCSYPTICGRYGICSKGQCSCPQLKNGDSGSYFRPVDPLRINSGCDLVIPISCRSNDSIQLLSVDEISYFNYIDQSPAVMKKMDESSCKEACLTNCSCKAALFRYNDDLTTGLCYLPSEIFSLMINNPQTSHYNSSVFLKVQASLAPPGPSLESSVSTSSGSQKTIIIIGVASVFVFAAIVLLVLIFVVRRRRRRGQEKDEDQFGEIPELQARFSHDELITATGNFKNKLGEGGYGSVYEGTLRNGTKVAVKRLNGVGRAKTEFLAEMKTLVAIHHINLVRLIGFCSEGEHRLLVFEFMPNGSLDKWIFNRTQQNASLDWKTKCKIISDIAKGLFYLHEGCKQRIIHLDIKPQNILLDEKFNAKVADFGLAKLVDRDQDQVMTRMRGTVGYLAPEWLTSVISEKADVFGFGVVVLEIVCGRKNLDSSLKGEVHLISLLQEKIGEDRIADMVEGRENYQQWEEDEALAMLNLAVWCLQTDSGRRPTMAVVVKVLEGGLSVETNVDHNFFTPVTLGKNDAACRNDINSGEQVASLLSGPR